MDIKIKSAEFSVKQMIEEGSEMYAKWSAFHSLAMWLDKKYPKVEVTLDDDNLICIFKVVDAMKFCEDFVLDLGAVFYEDLTDDVGESEGTEFVEWKMFNLSTWVIGVEVK